MLLFFSARMDLGKINGLMLVSHYLNLGEILFETF